MSASENELGALHAIVAQTLKERIANAELCSAADVNAAITFLKNNNITCRLDKENPLGELAAELKAQSQAAKVAPKDDVDLQAALDQVGHYENMGALN